MEISERKICNKNLESELEKMDQCLTVYSFISFDTEFQPFLLATPREASEEQIYDDFKYNVDRQHLMQIGFTLFDSKGNIGGTWEMNFRDAHLMEPRLNGKKGIIAAKNEYEGVDPCEFGKKFGDIVRRHDGEIRWVTFHGIYDFGYLLKILTGGYRKMPNAVDGFVESLGEVFNRVIDVKVMAKHCDGLWDGEIGLNEFSRLLKVRREGVAHRAGSDSLLTAKVYIKMVDKHGLNDRMDRFEGFLYGISSKIVKKMKKKLELRPIVSQVPPQQQPPQYIHPVTRATAAAPCYYIATTLPPLTQFGLLPVVPCYYSVPRPALPLPHCPVLPMYYVHGPPPMNVFTRCH